MPEGFSVGGIFATVSLETAPFDRGIARVMKTLKSFADDAVRASGGALKLDEGLTSVGSSSTRAATGLGRAGKESATTGTAQQRAAVQAAQYARASMDVAAAMDRTAALGPKVQGATLRQLAAQDRLNAVQEGGVATTRQLASAQAGLIGANRGVTAATEAAAASAKASSGAFGGMLKTAGELGLVLGGIEIAREAIEFVGAGKELTAALNGVQAASHATNAEMKGVRAQAIGIGKDLTIPKATAVDAADAINDLVRSGMTLPRAMASARSALLLASAAQVKTADGARFLGDVLDDFGLQSDQAAHVANVLAGAATSAGGGLEDMFEAIKYSGPVARAAGVNVDSLVAAVAELAKGGIQGSLAGTGLRSMLLSLAGPTKQNAAGMKALAISAWDAQGNFKGLPSLFGQLHTAQERLTKQDFLKYVRMAFGKPASAVVTAFAHQGIEGYDRFAKRVASGDVQKYADLMNRGLGASLAAVRKDFTAAGIDVYDKFGPNVSKVVALMAVNLPHAFHAAADVLHPFAVAGGDVVSVLGSVAHFAGEVIGALGPLAPELKAAAQTALVLWGTFKGYQVARAAVLGIMDTVGALQARMVSGAISARNYGAGISATFAGNATAAERAALVQAAAAAQTVAANAQEAAAVQQAAATEAVANAEKVADSGAASRAQIEFADANAAAAMASARSAQIAAIQTATAAETAAAGVATAGDEAALGWGAIAGPIGIAAAGIGIFATALFHSGGAAKQNTAEISSLTTAIQNDSGAIGENTRAQVAHTLQTNGALDAARKLGLNLKTVTDATLEGGPALQRLTALVQLYTVSSYGATKDSSARVAAARKLVAALGDENSSVGKSVQAVKNEAAANGTSTTATDQNTTAKRTNATAAVSNAKAVAKLVTAEIALISVQLSQAQSQDQFLESVRSTTEQLKGNNGSLSKNTANGLANRDALLASVQAALSLKDAQDKAGGSTEAHTKKLAGNIAALREAAIRAGADTGQVDKLLRSLHAMPSQIRSSIVVESAAAKANIAFIKSQLADLPSYKTITISTATKGNLQSTYNSQVPKQARAAGGTVVGPGTGTSDSVLIRASNGEEVVNAKQSAKHRGLIKAINAGMDGFASGGTVGKKKSAKKNPLTQAPNSAAARNAYNSLGSLVGRVKPTAALDTSSVLTDLRNVDAALTKAGASKKFVHGLAAENASIVALAKQRNTAAAHLAAATQAVADAKAIRTQDYGTFKAAGVGSFDLTSAGADENGNVSKGTLEAAQGQQVSRVRLWATDMGKLIKSNVFPSAYLRTLLGAGPSSLPTVTALLGMNAGEMKTFAANERTIDSLSGSVASAGAHKLDDPAITKAVNTQRADARAEARYQQRLETALNKVGDRVAAELSHLNVKTKLEYRAGDLYVAVKTDEKRSTHRKVTHK